MFGSASTAAWKCERASEYEPLHHGGQHSESRYRRNRRNRRSGRSWRSRNRSRNRSKSRGRSRSPSRYIKTASFDLVPVKR